MKGGFRAVMHFVDGSVQDFEYTDGQDLIHSWISDDWGAPPTALVLRARTEDGRLVSINIPYDPRGSVMAAIHD